MQANQQPSKPLIGRSDPTQRISIYEYSDYRKYLKEKLMEYRRIYGSAFKRGVFIRQVGFRSPKWFNMILNGREVLRPQRIPHFVRALGLADDEARYFERLVSYNDAANDQERQRAYDELRPLLRRNQVNELSSNAAQDWKYSYLLVRELVTHADFQGHPKWISERSGGTLTEEEAHEALEFLVQHGYVHQRKNGYQVSRKHIKLDYFVDQDGTNQLFRDAFGAALKPIQTEDPDTLSNHVMLVSVSRAQQMEVKRQIDEFVLNLARSLEPADGDKEVIQLNVHLNPLTISKGTK